MIIEKIYSQMLYHIRKISSFIRNTKNSRDENISFILSGDVDHITHLFSLALKQFTALSELNQALIPSDLSHEIEYTLVAINEEFIMALNNNRMNQISSETIEAAELKFFELENLINQFGNALEENLAEQSRRAKELLEIIVKSNAVIIPYKSQRDISLSTHHFLDEIDKGIILHLYVPNGRYQEDQLANFLRLFESYLQRVENLQVFIETRKTLHGQIYEFKSKTIAMNLTDVEVALSRFDQFMGLCQYDQKRAEAILLKAGMNASEASRLLTKYMKEYQRLQLDYEHERERKMHDFEGKVLDLRHRLESEALEVASGTDISLTQALQPSTLLSLPNNLDPIGITISNSSVIINPGIQSYIEQAIYGDIHYATEDKKLLDLFAKYAQGLEAVRLRSDLEQLKDTSSQEAERRTAKEKIVSFLAKVGPVIGQSTLDVLTVYVE
jgi:hypothetical protein